MELRDLIVTPIIIILIYLIAYMLRPMLTNETTRRYFFPALSLKIFGALAVGFIYQFYYDGGDTYNYHTYGSRIIWETFVEQPDDGVSLFFNSHSLHLYPYYSRILFYSDPSSFFVIKIAALCDLITFSSYSATAVLFAFFSFIGAWFFFLTFYELFPYLHSRIAIASFFIPSVFFWGSGLLKDTIIMTCLGICTFQVKRIFIDKKWKSTAVVILAVGLLVMFNVKKYVLLCFLPAALFWIYTGNLYQIRSIMLRIILLPVIIIIAGVTGFYSIQKVGESDSKYALDKISTTAKTTAYDIGFYSGKDAGSGYTLGEQDGSFSGMLKLAPQAINVSLFRPYLWEVRNPLMLLSALEACALFVLSFYLFFSKPISFLKSLTNPDVLFCLVFSVTFAFAVGVVTYNFGTLSRYKIPLLPYYLMALILIADQLKRETKLSEFESTE